MAQVALYPRFRPRSPRAGVAGSQEELWNLLADRHVLCCPPGSTENGLEEGIKQLHKHVEKKARGFLKELQRVPTEQ